MRAITICCWVGLMVCLAGCGQKWPQQYGTYVKEGSTWTSLESGKGDKFISVQAQPEILLFDRRLKNDAGQVDSIVKLLVTKYTQRNIEVVVARADGPPVKYTASPANQFVTLSTQLVLDGFPVEKHPDMLIVKPRASLSPGFYCLSVFDAGFNLNCEITNMKPESLPDSVKVDKWYKTVSDKNGFSWDGWMAVTQKGLGEERAFHERGIIEVNYRDISARLSLSSQLQSRFQELELSGSLTGMVDFCEMVSEFDADMYQKCKAKTLALAESVLKKMAEIKDWPSICGTCEILATNNVNSKSIGEFYSAAKVGIEGDERSSRERVSAIQKNTAGSGAVIGEYECWFTPQYSYGVRLMDDRLSWTVTHTPSEIWMGGISGIAKSYDKDWINGENWKVNVQCGYQFEGGSDRMTFDFHDPDDRDIFFETLTQARQKWADSKNDLLEVEIKAVPQFWSARFSIGDLPYELRNRSSDTPIEFLISNCRSSEILKPGEVNRGAFAGIQVDWIQVRAAGTNSATLGITFCPTNGAGPFNRNGTTEDVTSDDGPERFAPEDKAVKEEAVKPKVEVVKARAKATTDANAGSSVHRERVHVRHILVKSKSQAEQVRKSLLEGADFAEMAKQYSVCPSSTQGGDLGFFGRGVMVPEFEEVAFELPLLTISPVVETQFGFHIIEVLDIDSGPNQR